jgi:adenylate cyclase
LLGNVGAVDHYEYHPIGDIVNTATRIESLNKYLGTRILVSSEVIDNLDGFLVRELGTFVLVGKTMPVSIHELICRKEESNEQQRCQCTIFATVLDAFRRRSWEKAIEKSHECIRSFGEDGPSLFYMNLSEGYKKNPPEGLWDGMVRTTEK